MTLRHRVTALLLELGRGRCVGCIADTLGVPRKKAHDASIRLESIRGFKRAYGKCATCGKTRIVIAAGDAIESSRIEQERRDE